MYKKEIRYTDLKGTERITVAYFNLTTVEMTRLVKKYGADDLTDYLTSLVQSGNAFEMISVMADIVLSAYGKPSDDGTHFVKTAAIHDEFESSVAYAEYIEDLITNDGEATRFVENTLSGKVMQSAMKESQGSPLSVVPKMPDSDARPLDQYSREELEALLSQKHNQ